MRSAVLVVAKAPRPGHAKTRLARDLGPDVAADLAAAALLDTFDAVEAVTCPGDRMLSLAGDLGRAARGAEITERLCTWRVSPQCGATFAGRLVHAHGQAVAAWGPGRTVVQVGMDTPGLTGHDLAVLAAAAENVREVGLGPATDGGWWGLATQSLRYVEGLVDVPMSTNATCRLTRAALEDRGAIVTEVHRLTDVDDLESAEVVSREAPWTRFARRFADLTETGALR